MANIITCVRILCSVALLFCHALSPAFYVLYIIAGVTDMVDGAIARKTNTVSKLGSVLDTAADFVFVAACLVKLLPVLDVDTWIYVWIAVIAVIKTVNVVSGYVVQKRFVAVHSVMNKATGALLFALPLTLNFMDLKFSVPIICTAATFAAIGEGHLIRTRKEM